MLTSQSFGRLLEPGLRKIFMDSYKEISEQYTKIFKVQTSNKAIETDLRMGGFGLWEKKDSAGSVQFQDTVDPKALQYIHEEFASGFTVERKLVDDEQYSQISKLPRALARAARATVETKAAKVLNDAFTVAGFDGKSLIATDHVRLDGGSLNNLLSTSYGASAINGALNDQNLKAALTQARAQVDDRGILIQCQPKMLIVPPALEYTARTLVGSSNLSVLGNGLIGSGASNAATDKNVIQGSLEVVVMDYLTSSTAWFVLDPTVAELNFFWRKNLEFKQEDDFSTMQAKYRGYMRFSCGYSDYRGIVGSKGTGAA